MKGNEAKELGISGIWTHGLWNTNLMQLSYKTHWEQAVGNSDSTCSNYVNPLYSCHIMQLTWIWCGYKGIPVINSMLILSLTFHLCESSSDYESEGGHPIFGAIFKVLSLHQPSVERVECWMVDIFLFYANQIFVAGHHLEVGRLSGNKLILNPHTDQFIHAVLTVPKL